MLHAAIYALKEIGAGLNSESSVEMYQSSTYIWICLCEEVVWSTTLATGQLVITLAPYQGGQQQQEECLGGHWQLAGVIQRLTFIVRPLQVNVGCSIYTLALSTSGGTMCTLYLCCITALIENKT